MVKVSSLVRHGALRALTGIAIAVIITVAPMLARGQEFKKVVVFGDSLSDNGNLYRLSGNTFPPPPYFHGRFSNGPLWVEGLAADLRVRLDDHAFAGAFTDARNLFDLLGFIPGTPGMQTSVGSYIREHRHLDSKALYILWGGANDYLNNNYLLGPPNPFAVVTNLTDEIEALAAQGATTFLVPNLPDLDTLPGTLVLDPVTRGGLNYLTAVHNAILAGALYNLQLEHPAGTFYLMDVNSLVRTIRANPGAYELTDVSDQAILVSERAAKRFLFWDDVHPTIRGQRLLTELALDTLGL